MKIALCFIINYEHILNKEEIWKKWIEPNKDIINVYFYYKDYRKIKSKWILEHTIPPNYIHETSYLHVIPAYISIMNFALTHDWQNKWFCLLTDSCCPIISPKRFRYLFYNYYEKSLFSWKPIWWNPDFHKRANLNKLSKELWLANDPWFVLTKNNVLHILHFMKSQQTTVKTICEGGLANESLFAIIFKLYGEIENKNIVSVSTHITDWSRMTSTTSPHVFKDANKQDIKFIDESLNKNEYALFIRKIAPEFPDDILNSYIYERSKMNDNKLILVEPFIFKYNKVKKYIYIFSPYIILFLFIYFMFF